MELITLNTSFVKKDTELFNSLLEKGAEYNALLHSPDNPYKGFTGWLDLPEKTTEQDLEELLAFVKDFRQKYPLLVVAGIGGSYLGAKAVISALGKEFEQQNVIFTGYNLNEKQLYNLLNYLQDKNFGVCVISKSGTTTETAVAFRVLWELMYKRFGKEASDRIIAITSKDRGALVKMSGKYGYKTFVIPDDVGGRYSVLTPVGLVPIAFADLDIKALLNGAKVMFETLKNETLNANIAVRYAAVRNMLYKQGYKIEILANYHSELHYFAEWWKQLFGESEGKDNKGIFPAAVDFTTDLHSLGQYIQQGERILFETVLNVKEEPKLVKVSQDKDNLDGLNYLAGKYISEINQKALEGTLQAHVDGGVPNILLEIPQINEFYLGQLIYFFEKSCAISGMLLGVNPFDQPGVEFYKKNMFKLLGKPGY